MVGLLQKRPGIILLILGGYFLVNVLVRLLLPSSLELDEAEQAFISQWVAPGYDSQPPFYNWMQFGVVSIFGISVASLTILKNVMLFSSYAFYWLAARLVLKDRDLATVAVLGLLTIPQISFESQRDLTHTVAAIFSATLFFYGFFRTLTVPSMASYALTGVAIGLGLISKYNFALLPAAALIAVLMDTDLRKRLFDWRLALTALCALLVVLPHAVWLVQNLDVATMRTVEKLTAGGDHSVTMQIARGLFSFAGAVIGFGAVTLLAFVLVFKQALVARITKESRMTRLIERMFLLCAAAIILLILFGGAENIRDRWLTPLLLILPLYLCLKLDTRPIPRGEDLRRFLPICLTLMVIIPLILFGRVVLAGRVGGYEKQNVPYENFVSAIISAEGVQPSLVVSVEPHLSGNVRLHLPGTPVMSLSHPGYQPAYDWTAQSPILVVWRQDGQANPAMPSELQTWVSAIADKALPPHARDIALPYIYGLPGDSYHFGYEWLYPNR